MQHITDWFNSGEKVPGNYNREFIDPPQKIAGFRWWGILDEAVEIMEGNIDSVLEKEDRGRKSLESAIQAAEKNVVGDTAREPANQPIAVNHQPSPVFPPSEEVVRHAQAKGQPAIVDPLSVDEQAKRAEEYRQILNDIHEGNLHA